MLPDNVLSTTVVQAPFLPPKDAPYVPLIDYELGGVALNDASQGLMVKSWRCQYINGDFIVDAPAVAPTVIFNAAQVSDFSFTFDQNMQPFITYVQNGIARYRWYDSEASAFVIVDIPGNPQTPRCTLDDKRAFASAISDIILAYCKGNQLWYRQQRDRFEIETMLSNEGSGFLNKIGMNLNFRLQFEFA